MVRMKGSKQNFAQAVDNISAVDEDDLLDISPENVSGDQLKKRIDEELDEVIEEAEEEAEKASENMSELKIETDNTETQPEDEKETNIE